MIDCTVDNLLGLLKGCAGGEIKIAAIALKEKSMLEEYRDTLVYIFMNDELGIRGVKSIEQCLNTEGYGEVDCVVFENGALIFLYEHPTLSAEHKSVICFKDEEIFNRDATYKAAVQLGIDNEFYAVAPPCPASHSVKRSRKKATVKEADPLEEWLKSLKVVEH